MCPILGDKTLLISNRKLLFEKSKDSIGGSKQAIIINVTLFKSRVKKLYLQEVKDAFLFVGLFSIPL
jgi:hypothetical protein